MNLKEQAQDETRRIRHHSRRSELKLNGTIICQGIGIGTVVFVNGDLRIKRRSIKENEVSNEKKRYTEAVNATKNNITEYIRSVNDDVPWHGSLILRAYRTILQDSKFHNSVHGRIEGDLINAEAAIECEAEELLEKFDAIPDPFLQARVEDLRDLVSKVLRALREQNEQADNPMRDVRKGVMVSAHLHPSSVLYAHRSHARAFVTESRAISSHAAILLRGFEIPSVGNVPDLLKHSNPGNKIIVDALQGCVVIRPKPETICSYENKLVSISSAEEDRDEIDCRTADGTPIHLYGNMGNPEDVAHILKRGLNGVGLFRTEFFAMDDGNVPCEDEQAAIYRHVVSRLNGRRVVIRTFDIGADKLISDTDSATYHNPALGVRGIRRHLLMAQDELREQFRAILRSAGDAPIGIMVPMVTTLDDVRMAKRILSKAKSDLRRSKISSGRNIQFGAMIETPAAALRIKEILTEVDFVSLGTNDLLQYLMAADRDDEDVLGYNDPKDSAFLWLIDYVIKNAIEVGRQHDVSICGEIASSPSNIVRLARMGYRSFSILPVMACDICDALNKTDLNK